jgi:hypothetical protein
LEFFEIESFKAMGLSNKRTPLWIQDISKNPRLKPGLDGQEKHCEKSSKKVGDN